MPISQNQFLLIRKHARERAQERWGVAIHNADNCIVDVFKNGYPYGAQRGNGCMFKLDNRVICVEVARGTATCRTVLTFEMAQAQTSLMDIKTNAGGRYVKKQR